jgi:hypothetical protein
VLTIVRRAWFNLLTPVPLLGPLLMGKGHQRMARYMLLGFTSDRKAFSAEDVEIFVAQLREPARARAGSALYRHFIQPEAVRIPTGSCRSNRLSTPTCVLAGADDPDIRPDIRHGFDDHADDLKLKYVDGASHFVADDRPGAVLERALELFAQPWPEAGPGEGQPHRPQKPKANALIHRPPVLAGSVASGNISVRRAAISHAGLAHRRQAITESDGAGRETGERTRTLPPSCMPAPVRRWASGGAQIGSLWAHGLAMRLLHGGVERAGRRDDRLDRRAREPSAAQRSCSPEPRSLHAQPVSLPGIEPTTWMGKLEEILAGRSFVDILQDPAGQVIASRDGGERLIIPLTARLQDALASIDDNTVDEVAAQRAAPDEYYGTGADTELAAGALRDLVRLVRAGRERAETLYCWVCV